jgi:hypothetical protein
MEILNQNRMEIGSCEVPKLMFQVGKKSGHLEIFPTVLTVPCT